MCIDVHVKCPYCLQLYPLHPPENLKPHHAHPLGCPKPLQKRTAAGELAVTCFTCGTDQVDVFSKTQLLRGGLEVPVRCTPCIKANNTRRFELKQTISQDEQLHIAVAEHNVERVRTLLSDGADANYIRQNYVEISKSLGLSSRSQFLPAFHPDGTPMPEEDPDNLQPTTPLKLVAFRISDCLLDAERILQFGRIANLLLTYGAHPMPALQYMEKRYGKFNQDDEPQSDREAAFQQVCEILYIATRDEVRNVALLPRP